MADWLKLLDKLTIKAESPRSYMYWSGIATISAIMSPNVWYDRQGVIRTRPNLYILLVGPPGLGKAYPTTLSKELVYACNTTRVIAGRSTIEFILQKLSSAYSVEGQPPVLDARGYLVSGEFSTSMQRSLDSFTILTDLFDSQSHENVPWTNGTKVGGIETLKKPCITLFSGSSPAHLSDFLPDVNIEGGFVSRTLFVYEDSKHTTNYMLRKKIKDDPVVAEKLLPYLLEIKKVRGEFSFSSEKLMEEVEEWYAEFSNNDFHTEDKTGLSRRIPDHILKVAMCISLSKKADLIIERDDYEEAKERCLSLVKNTKTLTEAKAAEKTPVTKKNQLVYQALLNKALPPLFEVDRKTLLKSWPEFDSTDVDRIIPTLVNAEQITLRGTGGKVTYTLIGKSLEIAKKQVNHDREN